MIYSRTVIFTVRQSNWECDWRSFWLSIGAMQFQVWEKGEEFWQTFTWLTFNIVYMSNKFSYCFIVVWYLKLLETLVSTMRLMLTDYYRLASFPFSVSILNMLWVVDRKLFFSNSIVHVHCSWDMANTTNNYCEKKTTYLGFVKSSGGSSNFSSSSM